MSKNYHHYTGSVTRNLKTIITCIFSWHLCFVHKHHKHVICRQPAT